jgi:AcrR family transcriptional regulator
MPTPEGNPAPPLSSHDRILRAAKQLFAAQGYESTSTAAIARQAGTSESQLMKHFGSKEGLLEAIFDDAWKRINAAARDARAARLAPAAKLQNLVGLMLEAFERDPELKLLMLLEGRRIRREGHLVMLTAGFREFVGTVDSILREMRGAGELRADLPVEGVRSALMGAFEGLLRDQLLARRLGFPARYTGKDMRVVFAALLGGLGPARRRPRR